MSIVSNYARVTEDQLKQLRSLPERIEGIDQVCDKDAVIDLDKAAEVISWLLSPYKRAEQHRSKAGNEYSMNRIPIDESTIPPLPPMDDYIIAIEGRRHHWESTLEPGLHSACVFEPKQVRHFSSLLEKVDEVKRREQLDFSLMDQMDLPVEYWEEEGEETFSEYILPLFEQLKELYRAAAESGQHVIFWWT